MITEFFLEVAILLAINMMVFGSILSPMNLTAMQIYHYFDQENNLSMNVDLIWLKKQKILYLYLQHYQH